jgi:hypothetical protein
VDAVRLGGAGAQLALPLTARLDLICREPDGTVVVCEVKARTGRGYGTPLEAITHAKARRLRQIDRRLGPRAARAPVHTRCASTRSGSLWHPDGTATVTHERGHRPVKLGRRPLASGWWAWRPPSSTWRRSSAVVCRAP